MRGQGYTQAYMGMCSGVTAACRRWAWTFGGLRALTATYNGVPRRRRISAVVLQETLTQYSSTFGRSSRGTRVCHFALRTRCWSPLHTPQAPALAFCLPTGCTEQTALGNGSGRYTVAGEDAGVQAEVSSRLSATLPVPPPPRLENVPPSPPFPAGSSLKNPQPCHSYVVLQPCWLRQPLSSPGCRCWLGQRCCVGPTACVGPAAGGWLSLLSWARAAMRPGPSRPGDDYHLRLPFVGAAAAAVAAGQARAPPKGHMPT